MLSTVLPIFIENDLKIESCELTERRLFIKAVSDRLTTEVKKGDVVQYGLVVSSSDVEVLNTGPLGDAQVAVAIGQTFEIVNTVVTGYENSELESIRIGVAALVPVSSDLDALDAQLKVRVAIYRLSDPGIIVTELDPTTSIPASSIDVRSSLESEP
jgi:hypothetical protein